MKVISIWQPFASLAVAGHKQVETRSWDAPRSLIGNTLGIASTKSCKPEQSAYFSDEGFVRAYGETGLPPLPELPFGCLVGHVRLVASELMTEEMIAATPEKERLFGVWEPGRYAWRLSEPVMLIVPLRIRGKQGIFDWEPERL